MTAVRSYRTRAIVLKSSIFAERDRLLTILTPDHGKLRVLAKGVRRLSSRLGGHVGIFCCSDLFLVRGRTFDLVTQGQSLEQFETLRTDLWRVSQAFYAAELVDRFTEEQHPVPGAYDCLLKHLRRQNSPALDSGLLTHAFELEWLGLMGYRPQLYRCVRCAAEIRPERNALSYHDGGVLCPACGAIVAGAVPISAGALRILRNLQTQPEVALERLRPSPEFLAEAERAMLGYIQYLLDLRMRSVGFLEMVRGLRGAEVVPAPA
jgi:DNA repair protein RecO (recombination protein O)